MSVTVSQLEKICIDVCMDSLEACTGCATECKKMTGMEVCVKNCEICIQACKNCIMACKIDSPDLKGILEECISACKNCAEECEKYDHDHCQVCAQACSECVEVCEDLVESL